MVAWQLPPVLARTLALPLYGAEPWDDLHLTLCFFPDMAAVDPARVQVIMQDVLAKHGSLPGEVAGFGRFSASDSSDGKDVLYAALDIPGLEALREDLVARLEKAHQPVSHTHGYTPHVTLMYLAPDEPTPIERIDHLTLRLNHLVLTSPDASRPLRVSASQKAYAAHPFERQQATAVREYRALVHKGLQAIFKDLKKRLPDEIAAVKRGSATGSKALDDGQDAMLGALGCEIPSYKLPHFDAPPEQNPVTSLRPLQTEAESRVTAARVWGENSIAIREESKLLLQDLTLGFPSYGGYRVDAAHLLNAIGEGRVYPTLYRGMTITEAEAQLLLKTEGQISVNGITSWTTKRNIAAEFAKPGLKGGLERDWSVRITGENMHGYSIKNYVNSQYSREAEVLGAGQYQIARITSDSARKIIELVIREV